MTQTTKYYRDADGNYLGAWTTVRDGDQWVDHPGAPEGAIEVDQPPTDGRQKWDSDAQAWVMPLALRAAGKIAAIDAERDRLLQAGKLYAGLHVALLDKHGTDGPRADLSGMATHAIGVLLGLPGLSWPEDYQTGWIAVENERIPMPTPAEGLALAQAAGTYFAAVVQCARDKKDACLAAEDEAALDAVSIEDGWPENADPAA